ncbi:c6 zinc finger domain-containing protein [Diplodia corticola]|uniref:C6 zinc finger domain-containing protein n=1 Tax=Diplodia corticola TaxID=236234 RepID=A0A1J9R3Q5_9PEZI|nr:c6 zinc finger domain-containing protein [Diplodia corticola]OJD35209.1 c6 zinc finger domain-containing protein [Diplodia corticola]
MYPPHTGGTHHPSQQHHAPAWHSPSTTTNGAPPPPHWAHPPQQSPQPSNGAYPPPPPPQSHTLPPPSGDPRSDMTSLQQQQPYRLPAPHQMYPGPPPPDPYRQPPPHMYQQHQPAPRQRTAIACRYCRRRKIRCSGFEASEDGRCTNCVRFSQECIFTPVSAQTQAFVPAHTVWRGAGAPPPLYGAYGQPLPPSTQQPPDAAYRPPPPQPGYPLPSPTGPYSAPGHAYPPPPVAPGYDDRSRDAAGRKRPTTEPHTPTLPPPNPAAASQLPNHRASGPPEYTYPDPSALTPAAASPASSNASYPSAPPPPQQPYYAPQPPRRSSPQSTYSYDPSRASSSPHTQGAPSTPGGSAYTYSSDTTLRPPANLPLRNDGRTPPPPPPTSAAPASATGSSRAGMRISDMVSGGDSGGRSAADADMLNALNRRGM